MSIRQLARSAQNALRLLKTRLQYQFSPELSARVFTEPLYPADHPSWAATRPQMKRVPGGISWTLELTVPHENEVNVERYPSCVAISIPKPGSRLDTPDRLNLLRRTIPLTDAVPDVAPHVELSGNSLLISFTQPDAIPCDFTGTHSVLSVQIR